MHAARAALLSLVLVAQVAWSAEASRTVTLTPSGKPGGVAFLVVTLGALPSGGDVEITSTDGKMLGSLSPFAVRAGTEAGTYSVPLPAGVVHDGRVTVHLSVHGGDTVRAPTADEVKSIRAEWVPKD
jgi:propanediol utilization protein